MAMMRVAGEDPVEKLGIALNFGPAPVVEALFAPIQARVLQVAVRTGLIERVARGPVSEERLAAELELQETATRLICECLGAAGHLEQHMGEWTLTGRARRWLDPESDMSVLTYIAHTETYWDWWARLEEIARGGQPEQIHDIEPGDPAWEAYIRGQYELARLAAPEVARAIPLGREPRALLDVAGGHGWFAAALCRRHPQLRATVLDLPGSAAVGRRIMEEAGMAERVRHVEGDLNEADLGGPYDGALAFNIIHHLSPDEIARLLARVRDALRPHGTIAVLDLFRAPPDAEPDSGSLLGLFFHVTSGAETYAPQQLRDWLHDAGFSRPRAVPIRRIPAQTLYVAHRR